MKLNLKKNYEQLTTPLANTSFQLPVETCLEEQLPSGGVLNLGNLNFFILYSDTAIQVSINSTTYVTTFFLADSSCSIVLTNTALVPANIQCYY